ncbi:hypothetical protein FACS1894179_09040 [Bacteroidia bacterium]|nr:hypothetical protein FACS1894169_12340 [Bacteroidia bacterium]GHV41252.1 hypothetical protein FACS1894179_09040 [Bacteroidia bacterium]
MWIVIIIIAIVVILLVMASLGSGNQLYEVSDEEGNHVYMGTAKQCADFMQLKRDCGYKGRLKTKRYKSPR